MKKLNIILVGGLTSLFIFGIQSCEQPKSDDTAVSEAVTEAYNSEKLKIENEAATACEDSIMSTAQTIHDSLETLSAKQHAAALAKKQRALKAAQASAKKKATAPKKTIVQVQKEEMTKKANDKFNEGHEVKTSVEETKKAKSKFGD